MSATRDSRGIFLLQDEQLATFRNLGRICGVRLKKAARLCGEDPFLLSVMIFNRFCNRFGRLEQEKGKLRAMLDKKWRQRNPHGSFAPVAAADLAIESYIQRYVRRTMNYLGIFLRKHTGETSASDELGDDKILAQLVLYAANAEQCSFSNNHVSGSGAWRRLCRILREEKRRAMREDNLVVSRDKAMSFLASVFLAQLLGTYRAEPNTAFLDFIVSLHDTVVSAS